MFNDIKLFMNIDNALIIAKEKGYFVDKEGNVFSKYKKLSLTFRKYKTFSIRHNGIRIPIPVHRFVAYIKYGDNIFNDNIEVRHLDNNTFNNSWDNILLGSHKENMNDLPKNNRIEYAANASNKIRRFTKDEVLCILNDRKFGMTYQKICEKYNTSKSTLHYLFNYAYYSGARKIDDI
jgi:hypothetical protein